MFVFYPYHICTARRRNAIGITIFKANGVFTFETYQTFFPKNIEKKIFKYSTTFIFTYTVFIFRFSLIFNYKHYKNIKKSVFK